MHALLAKNERKNKNYRISSHLARVEILLVIVFNFLLDLHLKNQNTDFFNKIKNSKGLKIIYLHHREIPRGWRESVHFSRVIRLPIDHWWTFWWRWQCRPPPIEAPFCHRHEEFVLVSREHVQVVYAEKAKNFHCCSSSVSHLNFSLLHAQMILVYYDYQ